MCLLILIVLWLSVLLLRKRERERERELLADSNCVVAVCYLAEEEIERAACLF